MNLSVRSISKKVTSWGLALAITISFSNLSWLCFPQKIEAAQNTTSTQNSSTTSSKKYDYGRAWQQTLMFYEFQKSGLISKDDPSCNRNNWRGDCEWNDGQEVGLDLTGGWHDAGDHVKFNLPMSYSVAMMTWSYLEFKDTYEKTGQAKYALNEIRWVDDYLMKCHAKENLFYYQVGDGDIDHQFWGSPELIDVPGVREIQMPKISRPCYWVDNTAEHGGSAVCAEAAAALAGASIVFKDSDPEYSAKCIKHAKELYQMALEAQSDKGYMEHAQGYYSSTHFEDELTWGGVWIYKATGEKKYLETAESYDHKWGGEPMIGDLRGNVWTQCWDDVRYGAMLLIAQLDDGEKGKEHRIGIEYNLDYWSTGVIEGNGSRARGKFTPKGLVMINDWGSVRYAGAEAALAMFYCKWKDADPNRVTVYKEFAKSQADYILGSTGRNYLVGYNEESPRNPHHRAADGAWKNSPLKCPDVSRHTLVGAIVGGPDGGENYDDNRNNYCTNEVADDYNAGPMCLMAAMYEEYGGTIDPNMNANEEVGEEYYMDGCNYQNGVDHDGCSYCEVKLTVENHTGWPARASQHLKFRYFVNIKDAMDAGVKPEDFSVICYYAQRISTVTNLIPWNPKEGIYYVEVAFGQEEEQLKAYDDAGISYVKVGNATPFMYPGGDVECRADMQLRIASPAGVKWDYTKNPSYVEIKDTKVDEKKKIQNIPVYEGDKLVGGIEPAKTGPVDLTPPTVAVDEISIGKKDSDNQVIPDINFNLKSGQTLNLQSKIVFNPSNATDQSVTYQSMNVNVATVDENGTITGVSKGSTSIIVWANGGGKPANCVVNVDGGVEDLFSANVLGKTLDWTPPAEEKGPKVTSKKPISDSPSDTPSKTDDSENDKPSSSSGSESIKPSTGSGSENTKPSTGSGSESIKPSTGSGNSSSVPSEKSDSPTSGSTDSSSVTNISFTEKTLEMISGTKHKLDYRISPQNAENKTVHFKIDKPNIAQIDRDGYITAFAPGTVTVTVITDDGNKSDQCKISIKPAGIKIAVTGLHLNETNWTLKQNETLQLITSVFPSTASERGVTYISSNPEAVSVDENGLVTALKAGNIAFITVTSVDGQFSKSCKITVEADSKPAPEELRISPSSRTMLIGDTYSLKATLLPENTTSEELIWESENPDIATVNNGVLHALRTGTTDILVKCKDYPSIQAVCTITVKKNTTSAKNIKVKKALSLTVSQTYILKASVLPYNTPNKAVTFKSSNSALKILSRTKNSVKFKAKKPGITTINVISKANKQIKKVVTVNVRPARVTSLRKTKTTAHSITLRFSSQKNITGYEIQKYDAVHKKYKLYKRGKKAVITVTNLKAKTNYSFRVRAYKTDHKRTLYGSYSKVLSVKTNET